MNSSSFRLVFNGRWHPALIALAAIAVILFALWTYQRQRAALRRSWFAILATMRCLAIIIAAAALAQPALTWRRVLTHRRPIAVLLDISRSMSIADAAGQPRIKAARQLLAGKDGLLAALGRGREVKLYAFAESLSALDRQALEREIAADGLATRLGDAITQAAARAGENALAGIVLLSDGVSTAGPPPAEAAAKLGVPVYPIVLGARMAGRGAFFNVSLQSVPENHECIVNNTTNLAFRIQGRNLQAIPESDRKTTLLVEEASRVVASASITLSPEDGTQTVIVPYLPTETGLKELTARIEPLPRESVVADNVRSFLVNVTDPKLRILMIEGTLRTEYKFLNRTLASDPNVILTSAVKTAKDVFYVQGAPAVADLRRGLPTDEKAFDAIDVVILGDLMREEFDDAQLALLRRFVEEKGGGLIFTGGNRALDRAWADSPAGALIGFEPPEKGARFLDEPFTPALAPEGRGHPILEGCETLFDQSSDAIKLGGCNPTGNARPGVSVLAVHPERSGGRMPVILCHQAGKGRVLCVALNTTWKWYFHLKTQGRQSPYEKFWGQAARWVAGRDAAAFSGGSTLLARADRLEYEPGANVRITARVRTPDGLPADNAAVWAEIISPGSYRETSDQTAKKTEMKDMPPREFQLQHVPLGGGEFIGSFTPAETGKYAIRIKAYAARAKNARPETEPLGEAKLEIVVGNINREFDIVDADEDTLAALAGLTGGKMFTALTAARLPAEIESRETQIVSHKELNLHNSPLILVLFVGCLSAEWILRKKNQLI